jgi:uncharacterized protein (TIGR02594 family)
MRLLILALLLGGCVNTASVDTEPFITAETYVGLHERRHREYLKRLVGVDPVHTEWCAAFVNAILEIDGIPGSESVSDYPLTARSFLRWGEPVIREEIQRGDVVIFPRGRESWQGHVGFYIETTYENGKEQWVILGGNQDNTVSYATFDPKRALGIRRYKVKLYGMDTQ